MASERLYRADQYLIQNRARVLEVAEVEGCDSIVCDASVFFPEGGGQPSDIGTVSCGDAVFNILRAEDESLEDDVWHVTDAPAGTFAVGDEVELTIDWDNRFCNMQRHLGEHMLSGTMHTLFGGVNRGFHMGEDYITIDIELDGRMLSEEELDLAEQTVNAAIWADLPVSIDYFDDYEASLVMPVRKQVPHDGEVSVVTVGELPDPYDCIACCGTHPDSSGQVGLLAIYKLEPNKGMNRIYFDCGVRALEHLRSDMKLLTDIANRNSCKTTDLLRKLEADAEATQTLKMKLAGMSAYIKEAEKKVILEQLAENKALVYELNLLSVDDLLKLGFAVMAEVGVGTNGDDAATESQCGESTAEAGRLLILMHCSTKTALLFSSDSEVRCGALVKEKVGEFGGRGGGKDDNARAVFASEKDMRAFAQAVAKVVE